MYKLSEDIMIHNENEQKYLVNTETGKVYLLNDIAILIVDGLEGSKSIEEIKQDIHKQFSNVEYEQISSDVDSYIHMLLQSKALLE